ncbi:hypothetical protein AAC387_Pa08g0749 [Persea americana]
MHPRASLSLSQHTQRQPPVAISVSSSPRACGPSPISPSALISLTHPSLARHPLRHYPAQRSPDPHLFRSLHLPAQSTTRRAPPS